MKIGVFDSGYGGLTILSSIRRRLPEYDYIYLGDNARAPYGTHSFEVIYRYTLEAVRYLLSEGCGLIILACNTASAKALRTIQQRDLPQIRRAGEEIPNVLGVIRPTAERVAAMTETGHVGVLATPGTVLSDSYRIELQHLNAGLHVTQQACPMWVPIIECGEHRSAGADYFVDQYLRMLFEADAAIDTLVLGCTHYPLLLPKIEAAMARLYPGKQVRIIAQGELVAESLEDYLRRHTAIESALSKGGECRFLTTESGNKFEVSAGLFLDDTVRAEQVEW